MVVYQVTFIALTYCTQQTFMHVDSQYTGDKEWNFIGPNVILQNDELDSARVYQYEYGVATTVEDNTRHATATAEEVVNHGDH